MPLNTSSKRRSSVGLWSPWQTAPPSPTDSPGTMDRADRLQSAWSYAGSVPAGPVMPSKFALLGSHLNTFWCTQMSLAGGF